MNKITYIFGAGASRHALPVVTEIPERIQKLISLLESDDLRIDDKSTFDDLRLQPSKTKREYQVELIQSLRWMMTASANHASIDTFAKKLSIKGKYDDLKKLKIAMSVFFIFEQAINKPDFRYDSFFASLLTTSLTSFPENVRIISWNYDYQFELAYSEFTEQQEIDLNRRMLRMSSKYGDNSRTNNGFGIYKLNGTTALFSQGGWRQHVFISNLKVPIDANFVSQITRNYAAATYGNNIEPSLSFAWEGEHDENSIVKKVIDNTSDTSSLIVIGYSFPFFNREVDRKIIGSMTQLKKVYFQSPDADALKERFQAFKDNLTGIELISRFDVAQFLLPNEL
jgi:hypothetical protein